MNIQGTGSTQQIAQLFRSGGPSNSAASPQPTAPGAPTRPFASITNESGQNLTEIRGELREAVRGALQASGGSGDVRSAVEAALDETLEANGFDPAEVKDAMRDAGGPRGLVGRGGPPHGGPAGGRLADFNPAALLENGASEEDLVQSFLGQLRAGAQLDVEG